jgi:hypothetical protein
MGIDRIGKSGAPPPPDLEKVGKTGAVDKPFAVERTKEAVPADEVAGVSSASSPLAQLKAGAIDVERYLDLRVDEATKALEAMPPRDLAEIKKVLRDQLATDPLLVDLVKSATGKAPSPPEGD